MNKIKKIILYVALLVALCLCSTIAMKILDLILQLNYESIWAVGFRVGFIVWIAMIVIEGYHWMTKSFAAAFAPNIVVNSVAPGNIDTEMTAGAGKELVDWVIGATPMNRLGRPQEVADLVAFLCSEKAEFITGQIIDIDGGYSWRT